MKVAAAAWFVALCFVPAHAGVPPELKALRADYEAARFTSGASSRDKYILDLSHLRFQLLREGRGGLEEVDAEIIRHPVPGNADSAELAKQRVGVWHSTRHDYRFEVNGTWRMIDDPQTTTHGTWSIIGAQYSETFAGDDGVSATTFKIILADGQNFIFTDGTHLFYQVRSLSGGLPIGRDEQGR